MVSSACDSWTLTSVLIHLTNSALAARSARLRASCSPLARPRTVLIRDSPATTHDWIRPFLSVLIAWTPGPSWAIFLMLSATRSDFGSSFDASSWAQPSEQKPIDTAARASVLWIIGDLLRGVGNGVDVGPYWAAETEHRIVVIRASSSGVNVMVRVRTRLGE